MNSQPDVHKSLNRLSSPSIKLWNRVVAAVSHVERLISSRSGAWVGLLAALFSAQWVIYASSLDGRWSRSGNDLMFILPRLQSAGLHDAWGWIAGPWVGRDMFHYYRPTTSLLMMTEYHAFGSRPVCFQAMSLLLHSVAVVLLAVFLRGTFHRSVPALLGALGWSVRTRNHLVIEWTPAQTDIAARLLTLAALLAVVKYLEKPSRIWLSAASMLQLMAMGAKESTLIFPFLASAVVLICHRDNPRSRATLLFVWLLSLAFYGVRTAALGGLGYIPGDNRGSGHGLWQLPGSYLDSILLFLMPAEASPGLKLGSEASWAVTVSLALALWFKKRRCFWWIPTLIFGFSLATYSIGGKLEGWLTIEAWTVIVPGAAWLIIAGRCVRRLPVPTALALAWGMICWIPVARPVFNSAGNVYYLADTYWAFVIACFATVVFRLRSAEISATDQRAAT